VPGAGPVHQDELFYSNFHARDEEDPPEAREHSGPARICGRIQEIRRSMIGSPRRAGRPRQPPMRLRPPTTASRTGRPVGPPTRVFNNGFYAVRAISLHLHLWRFRPGVPHCLPRLVQADPASTPQATKLEAYECGIRSVSDSRGRYTVRFYIIAILFVIFDVETIFLFPWAVRYRRLGWFGVARSRSSWRFSWWDIVLGL